MRGINRAHQLLEQGIRGRIETVFKHGRFISGPEVVQFEAGLADYVGVPHCVSCGNGTDALSLILAAMDIGEGHAVFLPGYTFFATAEAVIAAGAQPVLVDVRACDGNIDPMALAAAIESHSGSQPKAVIAVDIFGAAADWRAIAAVAKQHGLRLIEDAAQSLGGQLDFERCGSFGDAAAVSFFPSKPLGGVGDGGAVLTRDPDIAKKVRLYSNHGRHGSKYRHITVGRNSRLDSIQAAVLLEKLPRLDEWVSCCAAAARRYKKALPPEVVPLSGAQSIRSAWAQFVVALPSGRHRMSVMEELQRCGIPCDIYYPLPLNLQPALLHLGRSLPVCERLADTTIALPIHPFITQEEQLEVIQALRNGLSALT